MCGAAKKRFSRQSISRVVSRRHSGLWISPVPAGHHRGQVSNEINLLDERTGSIDDPPAMSNASGRSFRHAVLTVVPGYLQRTVPVEPILQYRPACCITAIGIAKFKFNN